MDNDWLAEPAPTTTTTTAPIRRRMLAVRAGLIAGGALVGGLVVSSLHHDSTASANPSGFAVPQGGQQAGTQGGFQGGPPGGFPGQGGAGTGGGMDGEQHLSGTLVSVGASSVTIRTSSGTATYDVTSASQLVRDGQVVSLSALEAGDPVFVHVLSSVSGPHTTVERLFAGSPASGGPPNSRV